jgi:hypothetical protein
MVNHIVKHDHDDILVDNVVGIVADTMYDTLVHNCTWVLIHIMGRLVNNCVKRMVNVLAFLRQRNFLDDHDSYLLMLPILRMSYNVVHVRDVRDVQRIHVEHLIQLVVLLDSIFLLVIST